MSFDHTKPVLSLSKDREGLSGTRQPDLRAFASLREKLSALSP